MMPLLCVVVTFSTEIHCSKVWWIQVFILKLTFFNFNKDIHYVTSNLIHICRCLKYNNKLVYGKREVPWLIRPVCCANPSISQPGTSFPSTRSTMSGKISKTLHQPGQFFATFWEVENCFPWSPLQKKWRRFLLTLAAKFPDRFPKNEKQGDGLMYD